MKNIGKGIGNFISNPNAVRSAMGVPASEQTVDVKVTNLGSEPIVKPKAQPKTDLVPNPVKSTAITKKTSTGSVSTDGTPIPQTLTLDN